MTKRSFCLAPCNAMINVMKTMVVKYLVVMMMVMTTTIMVLQLLGGEVYHCHILLMMAVKYMVFTMVS